METYPVTVGQLSVWRELMEIPPERRWEANIQWLWDLPEGTTEPAVRAALVGLARRHGSLRTRYVDNGAALPRQWLIEDDDELEATVHEQVCQGVAPIAEQAEAELREQRAVIDVTTHLPFRALLLTDGDRPVRLIVIAHHLTADGVAAMIVREDFMRLLAGERLPPAPGPRELALEQQGAGDGRLRSAERHWRRTLAAAPRAAAPASGAAPQRIGARVRTGIPMPMAHAATATTGASLSSILLAVYHRAICELTGEPRHLMFSLSNNRYGDLQADMVTSLVQWAPLIMEAELSRPGAPLAEVVEKVHWKHFSALKHAACSPDAIAAAHAEQPDADAGYHYNPMLAPPGFPSDDVPMPTAVEYYEPARASGPNFYIIVRGLTSLDLDVRVNRPGWDAPRVAAFVDRVTHELNTFARTANVPSV
ncbi:hypothetical protein Dvina_13870 [Dactylosporangium vinaceum]|uniref:Condensation domain-containing protein n=1 Tax=Dactylosporangium vinaceum TaxID=53362 RepID=A0ABV5MGI8_9ACTN|nr:condensation domain-containing protein [Dactylosporangium vinaceum]UAB99065.1 hypothetical protein Dvina_13870 [Dactylosporangium vinaceum]